MEKKIKIEEDDLREIAHILSGISRRLSNSFDVIQKLGKDIIYEVGVIEECWDKLDAIWHPPSKKLKGKK